MMASRVVVALISGDVRKIGSADFEDGSSKGKSISTR